MKETKIYADEFCTTFASTTEMLEFLAERAKQSKWIRKTTRMLKLVPLEKEAETIEEACELYMRAMNMANGDRFYTVLGDDPGYFVNCFDNDDVIEDWS